MYILADLGTFINIVQAIITITAIIVGGIWTYLLFVLKRQKYPRAKIDHKVDWRQVTDTTILLLIDIIISNVGDILISINKSNVSIRQILPPEEQLKKYLSPEFGKTRKNGINIIAWKSIGSDTNSELVDSGIEIEPGEIHQIHSDILIDSDIQTIMIESNFMNDKKKKKEIGWNCKTVHDIKD